MFGFGWLSSTIDKKRRKKQAEQQRKQRQRIAREKKRQKKRAVLERKKERQRSAKERAREKKREKKERQMELLRQRKEIEREKLREKKERQKELLRRRKEIEREHLKENKRREKERIAEEKRRNKEINAEKKRLEKERIAEERKKEKRRIAEEKKREKEKNSEERKKKKERIAMERREKEEKKREKLRIAEAKRKEKEKIVDNKKENAMEVISELEEESFFLNKYIKIALEKEREWMKMEEEEMNKLFKSEKERLLKGEKESLISIANEDKRIEVENTEKIDECENMKINDNDSDKTICYPLDDLPATPGELDCLIHRQPPELSNDDLSEPNSVLSDLNDNDVELLISDVDDTKKSNVSLTESKCNDFNHDKTDKSNVSITKPKGNDSDHDKRDKSNVSITKPNGNDSDHDKRDKSNVSITKPNGNDSDDDDSDKSIVSITKSNDNDTDKSIVSITKPKDNNSEIKLMSDKVNNVISNMTSLVDNYMETINDVVNNKDSTSAAKVVSDFFEKDATGNDESNGKLPLTPLPLLTAPNDNGRKRKASEGPSKPSKYRKTEGKSSRSRSGSDSESASSQSDDEMAEEITKVLHGEASSERKVNKVQITNAFDGDEEYGVVEVYNNYVPRKLSIGQPHPDLVVETASLASVEPTDIWYQLALSKDTIHGKLSALQLEAIVYSSQAHEQDLPDGSRAGFLIGDGAGVGKGRTVAGIIFENYLKGRQRAIWVSVSNDLKYDAERDLKDIGAFEHIKVHLLKAFDCSDITSMRDLKKGVVFLTYAALSSRGARLPRGAQGAQGAGAQHRRPRLDQLLDWCGDDFDGVIVLDECHRAKNLCPAAGVGKPSKTGLSVFKLQQRLPRARLVYASATGATEPRNMAYMVRLGLWGQGTAFNSFGDFMKVVERDGVGAMEIVAMDMKLRGMYIARQLSFHGVEFQILEVPMTEESTNAYDDSVALWVEAAGQFSRALDACGAGAKLRKTTWGQFWGAHQRFFKYLCIANKVDTTVDIARRAVAEGNCAVIGLQSTGEARTLAMLGEQTEDLTDFFSTAEGVLKNLVEKQFPGIKKKDKGETPLQELVEMQQSLLVKISALGARLPRNVLDELVDKLGGEGAVAEMTGRRGRMVKTIEHGRQLVKYESRMTAVKVDWLNVDEKERFMDGDKFIAIISEAASSGISLQSDKRVKNQRRRVHITLELPWSADRAIQQFGRTHRCNQVNAPKYIYLISELAGEKRFASIVAKRLASLGALTHGDRRATETRDLSQFNIDNKYAKEALRKVMQAVGGQEAGEESQVPKPEFLEDAQRALRDVGVSLEEADKCSLAKFLNRLLGVPVRLQNCLFQYFADNLAEVIHTAQSKCKFDMGIVDVCNARVTSTLSVLRQHATGRARVQLYTVLVDRGLDWEVAYEMFLNEFDDAKRKGDTATCAVAGFYSARNVVGGRRNVLLYIGDKRQGQIYRPGTGKQRPESFKTIQKNYKRFQGAGCATRAEQLWRTNYDEARTMCSHTYRGGCHTENCMWGLRERTYHVLAGSVLAVWDKLEFIRMQVVRVRTASTRIIGTAIPAASVHAVEQSLAADALEVIRQGGEP